MSEAQTPYTAPSILPVSAGSSILAAVSTLPELKTVGVILIQDGRVENLRAPDSDGISIVVELRPRVDAQAPHLTPSTPAPAARNSGSSAAKEWVSLGFNCGGAVLAWVGVVGTGALAPVTGGLSLPATGLLWGGALAPSGQCGASLYRTYNATHGRESINAALDANPRYVWTMRGADALGLVGAAGALKEVKVAGSALSEAGIGWRAAGSGTISRPMRKILTESLELQGAKRVSSALISAVVKQRLLDAIAGAIGMAGSAFNGVVNDAVVWTVSEVQDTL